jgi:hypothetical protein
VVGIWLFDEGIGRSTAEFTGQHESGKLLGGTVWAEGRFGLGIRFDGATGSVSIANSDLLLTRPTMTVMAWVKLDDIEDVRAIVEHYDWVQDEGFGTYAMRTVGPDLETWVIWAQSGDSAKGGGALAPNVWAHCALTYDGSILTGYVNGVEVTSLITRGGDLAPSIKPIAVGVRGDDRASHWMAGVIDEVAIFDGALEAPEILDIVRSDVSIMDHVGVAAAGRLAVRWADLKF